MRSTLVGRGTLRCSNRQDSERKLFFVSHGMKPGSDDIVQDLFARKPGTFLLRGVSLDENRKHKEAVAL